MYQTKSTKTESNSKELSRLVWEAKGMRTQKTFADECGITYACINNILNCKRASRVRMGTLKKIAAKAENGVTYKQLLIAAGHIEADQPDPIKPVKPDPKTQFTDIEKRLTDIEEALFVMAGSIRALIDAIEPSARKTKEKVL